MICMPILPHVELEDVLKRFPPTLAREIGDWIASHEKQEDIVWWKVVIQPVLTNKLADWHKRICAISLSFSDAPQERHQHVFYYSTFDFEGMK